MTTNILPFPTDTARTSPLRLSVVSDNPAEVVILPVVRIERFPDARERRRQRREVSADICGND